MDEGCKQKFCRTLTTKKKWGKKSDSLEFGEMENTSKIQFVSYQDSTSCFQKDF